MEPPTKRIKLHDNGVEEENDDELAMTPSQFDAYQDPLYELDKGRAKAATRLKSTFEHIFQKYEKDFTDTGDEIDLETGEIIINNGHLESMRDGNEDGFRSDGDDDDESVSSPDERAKGTSDAIGKKASDRWDDPFGAGHTLSSLAMSPGPFGAPPPFSLDSALPSAQAADPTWQAPDIPESLLRDSHGFRNQFMGHPGSLEYNSFGQVRIRSSFKDVFGYQPPRKFMTAKSLAKKALNPPSSDGTEYTETEEEDILLRHPTPPPAPTPVPEPVRKAPSLTSSHSDIRAATSRADKSTSKHEDAVIKGTTRKRGRPKKSMNGTLAHESTLSGREIVAATKVKSASARDIPDTSQDSAEELQELESSGHSIHPTKCSTPRNQEPERSDSGHRRSARERKQTDFYGRTVTPNKSQPKKKVAAFEMNPVGSDAEKVGEHAPEVTQESVETLAVPAVTRQLEVENTASQEDQVEEGPSKGLDAISDAEGNRQASTKVPEAANLSMDQNELQRVSERLSSDRQIPTGEKQSAVPSVPNEVASQEVAIQPTEAVLSEETGQPDNFLDKDDRDTVEAFDDMTDTEVSHGTTASDVKPELNATNSVIPVEQTTEQDSVNTTFDEFEPEHSLEPQEAQAESPVLTSDPTPPGEASLETETPKSISQAPKTPSTTKVLRPRKSPNAASESPPEAVDDDYSDGAPGSSDSHDAEPEPATTTATPKRRRPRVTLVVVLPPAPKAQDVPSPSSEAPTEQAAQANKLPPAAPPTQEKRNKGTKAQKRPAAATPMTPRRSRSPHDTSATGASRTGRGRGSTTTAGGATPSSSSSSALAARYPHLSKSARRIALFSSLVPDDEDEDDEPTMNVLTPTSILASSPRAWTPSFSSPSASRSRSRVGLTSGRSRLMSMTPRRPGAGVGVRLFGPKTGAKDHRSSPTGPRQRVHGGGGGSAAQSSPLVPRTTTTPTRRAEKKAAAGTDTGSPTMKGKGVREENRNRDEERDRDEEEEGEEEVLTPGGTARRCGEDGVVCERDFCFVCCR